MSYLLKIDAMLVSVGGGITVRNIDGDIVIVAVGEVDAIIVTAIWRGCVRCGCRIAFVVAVVV